MEAVRVMIHDQDLHMHLWEEATRTPVYFQNRIYHSALGNKTPEEMFTSEKTKVSHLEIFGCLVYLHVPKEKRSKLGPLGNKGILVGYNEQSKAYRIYIPGFCQIEISRDVTFDEDASFTKSKNIFAYEDHEEEKETPRATEVIRPHVRDSEEVPIQDDHDLAEPQGLIETPQKMISTKEEQLWLMM